MRDYMPTRGDLGRDMMFRSCTIQVNLDFESEADMVDKMRIGIALQVRRIGGAALCGGAGAPCARAEAGRFGPRGLDLFGS